MLTKKRNIVQVGNIKIGGGAPVVVQAMTNTETGDIAGTVNQIIELQRAGAEIVRITVNDEQAAQSVADIKAKLFAKNVNVPLVGCFHYNGHTLLKNYPECARYLDKYRINPGNVGFGKKRDKNFEQIIEVALKHNKPIRIGANWGSLDQNILAKLMDDNQKSPKPLTSNVLQRNALIESVLTSAAKAEKFGLPADKIIVSAKVSRVQDLISVYRELHKKSPYPLHLGLTEAGIGMKGIVSTASALSILLQEGIGNTIRASITPKPGDPRTDEVQLCWEVLQSLGLRYYAPQVSSCPGCGRTSSDYFQHLAMDIQEFLNTSMIEWKTKYPGVERLKVAVMGCIVNGPGESKHADIGISLPGTGENPVAPVFIDGAKTHTLRGKNIVGKFQSIVQEYVQSRFTK